MICNSDIDQVMGANILLAPAFLSLALGCFHELRPPEVGGSYDPLVLEL